MSRLILIPVILALAAASPAFADDEDYARNGFYGSFKIAGNHYTKIEQDVKSDIEGAGYAGQVTAEGPLGLDVRAGYRFHPHLGADIEFLWFTKSTTEFTGTTSENPNIKNDNFDVFKVETLNFFGNLKGYILTGRIQPFAQVGVGLMHAKIDDKLSLNTLKGGDAFVARFGGGVELYINPHFAFVVEGDYLLPTGGLNQLNSGMWAAGIKYRF